MSPEDIPESLIDRVSKAVAHVHLMKGSDLWEAGTAFLVELGGRRFAFTARHTFDAEGGGVYRCEDVCVTISRPLVTPMRAGRGTLRIWPDPVTSPPRDDSRDIDVAVVECNPDNEPLWRSAIPFIARDIARTTETDDAEPLLLAGYPVEYHQVQNGVPLVTQISQFKASLQFMTRRREYRHFNEPPEGRGIHVHYRASSRNVPTGRVMPAPNPRGLSGGPLIAFDVDGGFRVVGLARAIVTPDAVEWCEPAAECARLLLDHPDEAVARDARSILGE